MAGVAGIADERFMPLRQNQPLVIGCVWVMALAAVDLLATQAEMLLLETRVLTVMTCQTLFRYVFD